MNGTCDGCGKPAWLIPLHGDKGGPLRCFLCAGAWHAEHTRRRKWGRIVIKAMRMFLKEGGRYHDLGKLQLHVHPFGGAFMGVEEQLMPGYADTTGAAVGDITSELLADTIALVHPDKHPPERQELAKRVTQELLALKPFVFPAPKPEPFVPTPPSDASDKPTDADRKKPSQIYPCELCAGQAPDFYCDPCKAEWDKRWQAERDKRRAKWRRWCGLRKSRRKPMPMPCAECGAQSKAKRKDARFCSSACRQRAHRKAVTANYLPDGAKVTRRNKSSLSTLQLTQDISALTHSHYATFGKKQRR
jgi:hypothetical protein